MVEGETVLFVDDEPDILNAYRRVLNRYTTDWNVRCETSPEIALRRFLWAPYSVVVTDLSMPGMTGLDLISKMRMVSKDTSFIVLTGAADLDTAITSINDFQIFRFFTKPCDLDTLSDGISAALSAARHSLRNNTANICPPVFDAPTRHTELSALDKLAVGVIIIDRAYTVEYSNAIADALASEQDGITISSERTCRAAMPSLTKKLHTVFDLAFSGVRAQEPTSHAISLPRKGRRPLIIIVEPLADRDCSQLRTAQTNPTHAVLFINDPEHQVTPSVQTIANLYALTASEATIVHSLANGFSLAEAAADAGLTFETARTYLKRIFSKTQSSKQSELVKLIVSIPQINVSNSL